MSAVRSFGCRHRSLADRLASARTLAGAPRTRLLSLKRASPPDAPASFPLWRPGLIASARGRSRYQVLAASSSVAVPYQHPGGDITPLRSGAVPVLSAAVELRRSAPDADVESA